MSFVASPVAPVASLASTPRAATLASAPAPLRTQQLAAPAASLISDSSRMDDACVFACIQYFKRNADGHEIPRPAVASTPGMREPAMHVQVVPPLAGLPLRPSDSPVTAPLSFRPSLPPLLPPSLRPWCVLPSLCACPLASWPRDCPPVAPSLGAPRSWLVSAVAGGCNCSHGSGAAVQPGHRGRRLAAGLGEEPRPGGHPVLFQHPYGRIRLAALRNSHTSFCGRRHSLAHLQHQ